MKAIKIVLLMILAANFSLANAASSEQSTDNITPFKDSYSLEELTETTAENYKASPEIQKAMRRFVRQDLNECVEEIGLSSKQKNSYFSAKKIKIGRRDTDYYLVFPSLRCASFYGAHAVAYWIISKSKDRFNLLYSGRSDGFDVLETTSKGLHDIRSVYGWTFIILKYNGTVYNRVSEGKFPLDEDAPNKEDTPGLKPAR